MKKNRIFLSYRRDDSPGYVSRLENELESAFGNGRVFRDATDIAGGAKWKNVIDANLHSSAVLLLIIGPRWEKIWLERISDEVNYVTLELLRARELDVPIIPVTLEGTQLSKGLDLGSVNFVYENQFHDISDKQGRWRGDVDRLVSLLEMLPGIGPAITGTSTAQQAKESGNKFRFKWMAAVSGLIVAAAIGVGVYVGKDDSDIQSGSVMPTDTTEVQGKASSVSTDNAETRWKDTEPAPNDPLPDISGTWQFKDGTTYIMQRYDNGSYGVESPGNGSGQARYIANMPGKLEIEMFGIGRGEFAGFNSDRAMGWFIYNGSSQQDFGALVRVK